MAVIIVYNSLVRTIKTIVLVMVMLTQKESFIANGVMDAKLFVKHVKMDIIWIKIANAKHYLITVNKLMIMDTVLNVKTVINLMNITIVFKLYKALKIIVSIMVMLIQKENGILIGFQVVKKFVTNVNQVIILIMNMNAQNYHQIVTKLINMVFVLIVQMDTNLTQLTIVFQYQLAVMMIIVSNTVTSMLKELFT